MCLDIRSAGTRAETTQFVLDQQLANEGLAEAGEVLVMHTTKLLRRTYLETLGAPFPSGNGTSSRRMFAKVAFLFLPLNGVVPKSIS